MSATPHRRRSRPPARPRGSVAWLAVAAVLGLSSVAVTSCGEPVTEPSVGSIDLTPDVVLVVDDDGLRWEAGPSGSVSTDPARWSTGTLLEVRNDGEEPHRVRAGRRFDTGTLQPDETTLVLFDDELTATTSYEVVDADAPDRTVTFELVPAPAG